MGKINNERTLNFKPGDWIILPLGIKIENKSVYNVKFICPKTFKYKVNK